MVRRATPAAKYRFSSSLSRKAAAERLAGTMVRLEGSPLPKPGAELALYMEIFNNLHVGVVIWGFDDPEDESTMRLVAVNPAAESMARLRTAPGAKMSERFPELFASEFPKVCRTVVRSGKAASLGVVHYGDEKIVEADYLVRAFPLPENRVGVAFEDVNAKRGSGPPGARGHDLTRREHAVLYRIAAGRADKQIALELGVSPLTVQKHVSNILRKMGAQSRTEASVLAMRSGLLY